MSEDEGIRLIAPAEAAEVAERDDAAQRRGDGIPRYGDRPPPPGGPRPALRFPLTDADAPGPIEPLQVAPVTRPAAPGSHEPLASAEPPAPDDAVDDGAVVSVESGDDALLHWTEPATGEVPAVVAGEFDEESGARSAASASSPRWRGDQQADWDEADDLSDLLDDPEPRIGALAPSSPDRPTHEEYLAFDDVADLAEPVRPAAAAPPGAGAAGAAPAVKKIATKAARKSPPPPRDDDADAPEPPKARPARRASGPADPGVVVPTPAPAAEDEGRDLGLSIGVGAMISVLALFVFWLGANVGAFFVVALVLPIVVLSSLELFNAFQKADYHPATLLGWVACAGMFLGACWRGDSGIALLLALSVVFTFAWYLLDLGPGPVVQNMGVTLLGIGYVGVLGAYAGAILHTPGVGVGVLFVTAWIVVWSDIGGYLIGRKIGRTPLSAASPNKTREGLAAGIVLSVVLSLAVSRFIEPFGDDLIGSLVFIVVIAAVAPFGDLAESRLKRDLGIKDMGSLIPGHGGVLDRFDAILMALPISFYLLTVLGLV
jgi:phosphatidate cytidylyltransferase